MQLTPDEAEFLWAVATRSAVAIRLPKYSIERLMKDGLIFRDGDWTTLTHRGRQALMDREVSLCRDATSLFYKADPNAPNGHP